MRLQDSIALVTGGGQGIGRAIARMFAREGSRVIIAARTADRLAKVKGEIEAEGGEVVAVPTDVGSDEDMERLFAAVQERFGKLDILVNNAGVGLGAAVDQVDMKDYHRLMDTNLKGMYLGCKLGVPLMKKAGRGSIINVSSVHGVDGSPMNTVYAATKGGIIGCTRALAAELAAFCIRVNTISPGAIWLERDIDAWLASVKPEHREEGLRLFAEKGRDRHRYFQPLEEVGEADDIAHCAVYLASRESRFVTGQNIVVDGGLTTYLSAYAKHGAQEKARASEEEMRRWFEEHKA